MDFRKAVNSLDFTGSNFQARETAISRRDILLTKR